MSFRFYKFCQSGIITFLSSIFALTYLLLSLTDFSLLVSIVLAIAGTFLCFLPIVSFFYPFIIAIYFIMAIIFSPLYEGIYFYLLLGFFILHLVRFISMFSFVAKNPTLSKDYDAAIRYGVDYDDL